jgi:hypothetical protein
MNNIRRDEEANGRPQRRRNRGGKKSKARKRGGGGNGGNAKASYRDYRRGTGVIDHKKKASNKDSQSKRSKAKSSRKIGSKHLQPIKCSSSSIMRGWKQELGALIRYYVHERCKQGVTQELAQKEVDQIYYDQGCGKEETKLEMLKRLGMKDPNKEMVDVTMIIEKDEQLAHVPTSTKESNIDNSSMMDDSEVVTYAETRDGKGLKLQQLVRPGEGPAHAHEQWTNVLIPKWAVGKSFYFECKNNAPIPLSCELFLDGTKVAFNAPLPSNSDRSIKPDNPRYSHRHQWILVPAKRVKLRHTNDDALVDAPTQPRPYTPRYNGIRPNYDGQRISLELYPDPTLFDGWRFTGSQQDSRVEFFEKTMNIGTVKLDFYYTTGTVKTTLYHITTGRNQLFRGGLTPEQYAAVLNNPRAHTNQGYRRSIDRPPAAVMDMNEDVDSEDEFDQIPHEEGEAIGNDVNDDTMGEDGEAPAAGYFARNDDYNFSKEGHNNRRSEMNKLQHNQQFNLWKDANRAEYSCIHAKFYVSIPKRQNGGEVNVQQRRRKKGRDLLPLPNQSSVTDIKAAEKATIGTKFERSGPPQRIVKSYVRMERINGLTDEKKDRGYPVYEKKLYYRAEHVLKGQYPDSDDDDTSGDDDDIAVPSHNTTLDKYKALMIEKIRLYHPEMCKLFPQDAAMKTENSIHKILQAESEVDVDAQVQLFVNEFFPSQFAR